MFLMNDTNMNRLPVPTWNQCGVNTAPAAAALPEPAGDWGEANFAVTLPAGVGESEEEFTAFAESGMGAETDAFVLENATVRHALTVAEGVTVAEPAVFEFTLDAAHPNAVSVLDVDVKANASVTLVQVLRGDMWSVNTDCYAAIRGAPQLLGLGTGGSMTGKHADIILTDDIVNLQDRISVVERKRICGVYQELQNIRNPGGRILNTGTPWHPDDAFRLMPPPEKYDCYQTGLLTKDAIAKLRAAMSPTLFAANYELRHIATGGGLFEAHPPETEDPLLLRDGIAHLDASYGGEDFTALTCGCIRGGRAYLYGRIWQKPVDSVLDEALSEARRLLCEPVYCETNGDKGYLAREIAQRGFWCGATASG